MAGSRDHKLTPDPSFHISHVSKETSKPRRDIDSGGWLLYDLRQTDGILRSLQKMVLQQLSEVHLKKANLTRLDIRCSVSSLIVRRPS